MKLVACITGSGRLIYYANGMFYLDGNGTISARKMKRLDDEGSITWLDADVRLNFRSGSTGAKRRQKLNGNGVPKTTADPVGFVITLGVAVFVSLGAVGVSSARAEAISRERLVRLERASEAHRVSEPVNDLVVATQRGVTRGQYDERLARVRESVASYRPEDAPTSDVALSLRMAQDAYAGADAAWLTLSADDPEAAFAQFKAANEGLGLTATDAEDAMQELWSHAAGHALEAAVALDDYVGSEPVPTTQQLIAAFPVVGQAFSEAEAPDREAEEAAREDEPIRTSLNTR
ncbi:MAG: hypothetical protein HY876_03400 [Coriobacteriales bacterium]|nr:hypothetical protein [Coriobacteriales bacterium]